MTATVEMKVRVILPAYRQIAGDNVLLRVPCQPCGKWHTHGNGLLGDEITRPGDRTHRVSHCAKPDERHDGYYLEIQDVIFENRPRAPKVPSQKRYRTAR